LAEARNLAERNDAALRDSHALALFEQSRNAEAATTERRLREARQRAFILGMGLVVVAREDRLPTEARPPFWTSSTSTRLPDEKQAIALRIPRLSTGGFGVGRIPVHPARTGGLSASKAP
jgi:hypothetical protein